MSGQLGNASVLMLNIIVVVFCTVLFILAIYILYLYLKSMKNDEVLRASGKAMDNRIKREKAYKKKKQK